MPQIIQTIVTPVMVEKSISDLERELFPDGNVDWDRVRDAFVGQFPPGATMTDQEVNSLHGSWFNRAMVDEFLPYMSSLSMSVTGMRTTCTEEITRDVDGYVNLHCHNSVGSQTHDVSMKVDGKDWRLRFVEFSYETDDNTQLSPLTIVSDGATLLSVDENNVEEDWDALISELRSLLPNKWVLAGKVRPETFNAWSDPMVTSHDGREVRDPAHFPASDPARVATMVALLVRFYSAKS